MPQRQSNSITSVTDERFSPRAILKAWRPERFSDSEPVSVPALDRSMLEYHLGTLTSRSQEADFAKFALRLAEREVCPNILPQTGPTGGGDSKADAETYPVADGLSLAWYTGIGREAGSERWAFAFSAMKKWRPKVQSDVAKIAATGRGYTKAFFVTNQFVPDKTRADVEDKLRTKHKLDIRILDRTWILDRVFGGRHERLAIDELRLTTPVRHEVRKGPLDVQRETDLAALEDRIQTAAQTDAYTHATVDDCLTAAELARGLDRPRVEVDGRYQRAERLAKQLGTTHQQLECAYSKAWTTFWWYEDCDTFTAAYGEVERLVKGSRNAYHLGLLSNLRSLLYSAVRQNALTEAKAKLVERTGTLTRELDRLSSEANRPSTALQARAMRLSIKLLEAKPPQRDPILGELTEVIDRSEGLVGFPLETLAETLLRLGEHLGTLPAYGKLFERITEVMAKRKGEVVAARMLWQRGGQELGAGRPYEAIRHLGRSLTRLHKHESRHDAIRALLLCGTAYEQAGLLWAARGSALAAAALATGDYWTYSEVTRIQADSYGFLRSLELRLGRLPHALAWHEVCRETNRRLTEGGEADNGTVRDELLRFDALLGIFFLRADFTVLPRLCRLPDVIGGLGLDFAAIALLFALGYDELLPEDLTSDSPGNRDLGEFFAQWRDQPAAAELPATMTLCDGPTVELVSNILGCRVVVESDTTSPCVDLAESVVAALESFAATGHAEHMAGREPVLTVRVTESDVADEPFGYEFRERDGRPHFDVTCRSFSPHSLSPEAQGRIKSRLMKMLAEVTGRAFLINGVERVLGKLIKQESAFDRALNFTGSFGTVGNVLGNSPKSSITAWLHPDAHEYPLKRPVVWDADNRVAKIAVQAAAEKSAPLLGQGIPPPGVFDPERVRHSDMRTVSLIREPLWNRAGWSGTVFAWEPIGSEPPVMALMFKDPDVGAQIFNHLYAEVGPDDQRDALRVSIIRGIDRHNPYSYRIVIGSSLNTTDSRPSNRVLLLVARVQTMTPPNSSNLDNFLNNYARAKSYALTYALPPSGGQPPQLASRSWIVKAHLHVREAWQIGRNDLESSGLQPDDDPVIPPDQPDAPILELLSWKREQQ
jgi:tetratricopeptide (TPR) repeat protein